MAETARHIEIDPVGDVFEHKVEDIYSFVDDVISGGKSPNESINLGLTIPAYVDIDTQKIIDIPATRSGAVEVLERLRREFGADNIDGKQEDPTKYDIDQNIEIVRWNAPVIDKTTGLPKGRLTVEETHPTTGFPDNELGYTAKAHFLPLQKPELTVEADKPVKETNPGRMRRAKRFFLTRRKINPLHRGQ